MKYAFLLFVSVLALSSCKKKDKFGEVPLPSEYIDNDFEAAKEESVKTGKPILIDFYASWCSLCTSMKKETFNNQTVLDYLKNNFVVVFIDVEKGDGVQIASSYNAKHLNQAILNANFSLKAKRAGKVPYDVFLDWVKANK